MNDHCLPVQQEAHTDNNLRVPINNYIYDYINALRNTRAISLSVTPDVTPPYLEHPKTETWQTNSSITLSLTMNLAWEDIHSGGTLPPSPCLWPLTGNLLHHAMGTPNSSSPTLHKTSETRLTSLSALCRQLGWTSLNFASL